LLARDSLEYRAQVANLVRSIAASPEVGYQEVRASRAITDTVARAGYAPETGIAGMPTAFRVRTGTGRPVVSLLAEYDALPELGHACGHNVIAGAAVAAFLLLARRFCVGTMQLIGCPAEESTVDGAGGKIRLLEAGYFSDVDAALMVHPYDRNLLMEGGGLAALGVDLRFTGKAAHAAAAPESGRNAVDAAVQTYNAISMLRQQLPSTVRVHGIFIDAGTSPSVIPATAALRYRIRAPELASLDDLLRRVMDCAAGAARSAGCRFSSREFMPRLAELRQDPGMAGTAREVMQEIGEVVQPLPMDAQFGSTDFGNVSQVVRALEVGIQVAPLGTPLHSARFARAASQRSAAERALIGGLALSLVAAREFRLLGQ
jgi:amidohydrolase